MSAPMGPHLSQVHAAAEKHRHVSHKHAQAHLQRAQDRYAADTAEQAAAPVTPQPER